MPININGEVTLGTKRNLIAGVRSSAMPEIAVNAVMAQAATMAEILVDTYSAEIAPGEVGINGSGKASPEPIIAARAPRALLYGRVQSGKTVSMILTAALCLDNGFRVVVVLTTDNVALVRQTAARFKDLDGPRVFAAVKEGPSYEWQGQEDELRESVSNEGLVLVCAKNGFNLPEVIRFLQQLDASDFPVLVFDDEADAATPDTTVAARSALKPSAPEYASTINRLVIANDRPDEEGFSLGEVLPHSVYVQVTATPYVLFLQREASQIKPTKTFLLEPGIGYCGGEEFFAAFDPEVTGDERPKTIVVVGANEGALMKRAAPEGLAKSINFFILSACALAEKKDWPTKGYKHLSHTSHKTDDHEMVSGYIEAHLNLVRRKLRADAASCRQFFKEAYEELNRSLNPAPALDDLISSAKMAMRHAEVYRINSRAMELPQYGPRLNFLVGGNILGRGLTIDELLVTYYVREAKTSQMDTVWQHARMYGYRRSYLDHVRIYLPSRLAARFRQIHEAEEALRSAISANDSISSVLIRVPAASRPTRPNALEAGAVRAVRAGRNQIFPHFLKDDEAAANTVLQILQANDVPVGESTRNNRATTIPLEAALSLVEAVELVDDDPGLWSPGTISALMTSFGDMLNNGCTVYVREFQIEQTPPDGWWRGRLSGPEITLLRQHSPNTPSLALLYRGAPDSPQGWYPTLVMPPGAPTYVFTAED